MSATSNPQVVEMFERALAQARRGEISSAILLTMNGDGGHTGHWAQICAREDARAVPQRLKEMEVFMRELLPNALW